MSFRKTKSKEASLRRATFFFKLIPGHSKKNPHADKKSPSAYRIQLAGSALPERGRIASWILANPWKLLGTSQSHGSALDQVGVGPQTSQDLFQSGNVISEERICGGSLNHFLFRGVAHEVRILVVRHHHRYPSFGSKTSIGVWPSSKSVA